MSFNWRLIVGATLIYSHGMAPLLTSPGRQRKDRKLWNLIKFLANGLWVFV